ncbi:hypothetical protein Micbo1qcDRAFT_215147 [Microdochium bolleyi]|uniref:Uncharacterized protein n=1 Tax=Microdochium bolleyi TaxID=196109 RepID=A0A136ISH6_9PEZI|nr:hypothetical protein Micbo1qcDRAFT_215147 [Microdochium bolleyi]
MRAILAAALLLAGLPACAGQLYSTAQFQQWYPQYGFIFAAAIQNNCTEQYERYLTGDPGSVPYVDSFGGGGTLSVLTQPVILCILDHTSEYVKSVMASAQVVLGVLPSALALSGATHEELGVLSCIGRRPLLAFLLALGSPAMHLSRAFDSPDLSHVLRKPAFATRQPAMGGRMRIVVSAAEYALVLMAVTNVALLCHDLGVMTICTLMSNLVVAPLIYSLLGLVPYLGGAVAICLRVRREAAGDYEHIGMELGGGSDGQQAPSHTIYTRSDRAKSPLARLADVPRWLQTVARCEFVPCLAQTGVRVRVFGARKSHIFVTWLLSTSIIVMIVLGTTIFSSLMFIGPKEALGVAGRYFASTIVCRLVLTYELSGLRQTAEVVFDSDTSGDGGVVRDEGRRLQKETYQMDSVSRRKATRQ